MKYQREEILQPSWQVLHLIRQVAYACQSIKSKCGMTSSHLN